MTLTLIVAGSRWADRSHVDTITDHLDETVDYLLARYDLPDDEPVLIVEGDGPGEPGVDKLVDEIAVGKGYDVQRRPARWAECGDDCPSTPHRKPASRGGSYCPKAGPRRNREMVDEFRDEAKVLLAFPEAGCGGRSGTWTVVHYAADCGLEVMVRPLVVERKRWHGPYQPASLPLDSSSTTPETSQL